MSNKKKKLEMEHIPGFEESLASMPEDSRIFVDKTMEITHYIFEVMEQHGMLQKDLAEKMGKTEAEVSKLLGGMHNFTIRSLSKIEAAIGATIVCTPKESIRIDPLRNMTFSSYKKGSINSEIVQSNRRMAMNYGKVVYMGIDSGKEFKTSAT